MRGRIALFVASLMTALVLAFGLAAAGFAPTAAPVAAPAVATEPPVQVDTVYVAAPDPQQTVVVQGPATGEAGEGAESGESD